MFRPFLKFLKYVKWTLQNLKKHIKRWNFKFRNATITQTYLFWIYNSLLFLNFWICTLFGENLVSAILKLIKLSCSVKENKQIIGKHIECKNILCVDCFSSNLKSLTKQTHIYIYIYCLVFVKLKQMYN